MKLALLAFLLMSCTHWLIETDVRIQVKNNTGSQIHDFSIVSQDGQIKHLVSGTIEPGESSRIYEYELVGEFNFVVFSDGIENDLGIHKLKGGMILAQITEKNGEFAVEFK